MYQYKTCLLYTSNLAEEYFNRTHPYGQWKDSGIRLEGDAVRGLTLIFLELWGATQKAAPDVERYLPDVPYTCLLYTSRCV